MTDTAREHTVSTALDRIVLGMEQAAVAVCKALLDERVTNNRSDPIYANLHDALNHMAAVRMLAELTSQGVDTNRGWHMTCGDYPAPCNCDDPETHNGHNTSRKDY